MTQRDIDRMVGLRADLIAKVNQIYQEMKAQGWTLFVVEGLRTDQRQAELYQIGRGSKELSRGAKVVTFKDGKIHRSNHQAQPDGFGHAVDMAFLPTEAFGDPFDLRFPWEMYGECAEGLGLRWGGRWAMGDHPHIELPADTTGLVKA